MKYVLWLVAVILVLAGIGYFVTNGAAPANEGESNTATTTPPEKTYANDTYGIALSYPDSYTLQEHDLGTPERERFAISIIDTQALANVPQNGEGPPAITFDIFQNDLDNLSVEDWIRGTNDSNFKLSPDGAIGSTTVSNVPALSYTWDGLYRGKSVVFEHKGHIIMASVTFLSQNDRIVSDFDAILRSLQLR